MNIHLRLAGGLGNQLYQMAALALAADRLGLTPSVVVDGLSRYAAARQPEVFRLLSPVWRRSICHSYLTRCWVDRLRIGRWVPVVGMGDRNFWAEMSRPSRLMPAVMDGYFQSGWTLASFERAIQLLAPTTAVQTITGAVVNECAVHIRGGDFLSVPLHQVLDHTYYVEAIRRAMADGWRRFVVITDDPIYAETIMSLVCAQLGTLAWRMSEASTDALQDFEQLRRAPARIIGNSTFSWWATALDQGRGRTWAPVKFTLDRDRDFFLPWEEMIP